MKLELSEIAPVRTLHFLKTSALPPQLPVSSSHKFNDQLNKLSYHFAEENSNGYEIIFVLICVFCKTDYVYTRLKEKQSF